MPSRVPESRADRYLQHQILCLSVSIGAIGGRDELVVSDENPSLKNEFDNRLLQSNKVNWAFNMLADDTVE